MRLTMDSDRVVACTYSRDGMPKGGPWYGILYLERFDESGRCRATFYEDPGAVKKMVRQIKLLTPATLPAAKLAGRGAMALGVGLIRSALRQSGNSVANAYAIKRMEENKREMDSCLRLAREEEHGLTGAKKLLQTAYFSDAEMDVVRDKGQDALLILDADADRIVGFVPDRPGKLLKNRLTAQWKNFLTGVE